MSAVNFVNSEAEVLKKAIALAMNINAAKGLQEVMQSNLGPKGTLKMFVLHPVLFLAVIGWSEVQVRSS